MVKGNKLSALVDRNGHPSPTPFPLPMSMIPGSMNQPSKHLRFPMCRIALRSSPQMQSTMPGRFISTTGTEESRAISRSTGDPGNTRNEEGRSGLIQNYTGSAVRLNGSLAGSRHSRRLFPGTGDMSAHSWD